MWRKEQPYSNADFTTFCVVCQKWFIAMVSYTDCKSQIRLNGKSIRMANPFLQESSAMALFTVNTRGNSYCVEYRINGPPCMESWN